ncbi:RNA polymerase sigma factor [Paenibacillus aquistagni]|uniref:RNA polymerase sigma factor n=1 Tax=Paenibacillus aquistagni TaxID=1852522 RepID=UPI000B507826|nr:sigma-70 family RNA polymerase sigma factor [Paenibacillus aquistagni]
MKSLLIPFVEGENNKQFITNLYLQHYPLLKKQAYKITKDYSVVDDLIHDVFLKLIPKIPLLRSLSSYKVISYLVYTVRNVCIDYLRKKTRRSRYLYTGLSEDFANQIPDQQAATEEQYIQHEELEGMVHVLLQLSSRDQSLLYYKYNLEMNDREIATMLDIPTNHIRQYVARARKRAFLKWSQRVIYSDKDK